MVLVNVNLLCFRPLQLDGIIGRCVSDQNQLEASQPWKNCWEKAEEETGPSTARSHESGLG